MTPALFLDRDGVVNIDHAYVHRIEDFEFVPGIFGLVGSAAARGWPTVIVTNQAGIGRGYFTEADFTELTAWMCARFAAAGTPIARVYHCPTHPTAGLGAYRVASPMRKPAPGMLLAARDDLGIDMARSVLVGDKPGDVEAGLAAGVGLNLWFGPAGAAPPPGGVAVASLAEADAQLNAFAAATTA